MPLEIQTSNAEALPVSVISVLGKKIGEVTMSSVFGDLPDCVVADSTVILPLNGRVTSHNERAQEVYGPETRTLTIVDNTELSFEGVGFRFNSTPDNVNGGLINMILAAPGSRLSVPDLKIVISSRVGQTITAIATQFSDPPLIRDTGRGEARTVGLWSNVVVKDARKKPADALVLARKNLASATKVEEKKHTKNTVEVLKPTRFVPSAELVDALEENRYVRINDVATLNKLTRQLMSKRHGGQDPNQISIIDDTHMQINGETVPVGPRTTRFFNHLLASYTGVPRTLEQIFLADSEPERQTTAGFIRQLSHKKWFRGCMIDGKESIVLEPAIIVDRRPRLG